MRALRDLPGLLARKTKRMHGARRDRAARLVVGRCLALIAEVLP